MGFEQSTLIRINLSDMVYVCNGTGELEGGWPMIRYAWARWQPTGERAVDAAVASQPCHEDQPSKAGA